ncbi:MAG: LegC family aminotransferase [Ruminococcus sp.]|nr:LegC family aminotransferase [Ruminococcus sp.]
MFEISLSEPNLRGNEIKYVTQAIESQWVSITGPFVGQFQNVVEDYVKADNAIPMQNATSALHMALIINEIGEDHEVIAPTLTFIASVNCIKYVNATPIFMDCDRYGSMDAKKLRHFCQTQCTLTDKGLINNKTGKHIKAVVVTHVFGNMADMESIVDIAKEFKLVLIEDSAQALGTYYTDGKLKGQYAGTFGDCGVYSYNSNKIITCGSGGTLVVKDKDKADKVMYLSAQAKDDGLRYKHNNVGYNYMMNNIQAAVGIAQMEQLESFIKTKENNYNLYKELLKDVKGITLLPFSDNCRPNYWFFSILVDEEQYGMSREELMNKLSERKIQTRPVWGLVHKQKPYENCQTFEITQAEKYADTLLNIPCGSTLTEEQVKKVVDTIKELAK